jgi:pimeloyl-ACP methyl ester carboxylesterase
MRAGEVRATGRVAGTVLGGAVGLVRDLHLSIADRAFGAGPSAGRTAHEGIARAVYGTVEGVLRWAPQVGGALGALAVPGGAAPLDGSRQGNTLLGAMNGLWGDRLSAAGNELALDMTVRARHADLALTAPAVAVAFPAATGRLAVFVHGLCETDDAWTPSARRGERGAVTFGTRLEELGYTPVYVRYNSGLRIWSNGARLSALLEELVEAWPQPVEEIALIGHSMGGLVARSACHRAAADGARWVERARHVFGLGTPHGGAPLEQGVHVLAKALHKIPETAGLAGLLDARSAGIKDLRRGTWLEEEAVDDGVDARLDRRASEVPFLPHVSYYFVGVTITRSRNHPLGWLVGDLLVQFPSASGRSRRRQVPFDLDKGHHLGGLNHFDLLTHPDVCAQLERWLSAPAAQLSA